MSYRRNAGSGIGEIIKWGLIGVAAYWVYTNFFSGTVATTTTPATTPPATTPAATTPASATSSFNTLDAIYSRMVAAATADKAANTLTADQWNVYLGLSSNITPPAPGDVFGDAYRANPSALLMTSAQYWSGMSAYLAKNMGMSGLGFYGGLGVFMRRATA